MRCDGVSTAAVPVEAYVLDADGRAVAGLTTLVAQVTVGEVTTSLGGLVAYDAAYATGLYHLPGGYTPPAAGTYALEIRDTSDDAEIAAWTLVVGPLAGAASLDDSLLDDLVTVADDGRMIAAELGARPFRTRQIRRAWTGGAVGRGACRVTAVQELLPPPAVVIADQHTLTEGGLQASGTVTLREVSLTYTQAQLLGEPLGPGEEFFVALDDAHGQGLSRRLAIPQDHPNPDREKRLGWDLVVRLVDLPPLVAEVA